MESAKSYTAIMKGLRKFVIIAALLIVAGIGWFIWKKTQASNLPPGIAFGNGRIEATEVDVAAKQQGRVEAVLANEGDMVKEGDVLARMDVAVLEAQLHEAKADKLQPETDRNVAGAVVGQRENEYDLALKILNRTQKLFQQRSVEQNQLDKDQASEQTAKKCWPTHLIGRDEADHDKVTVLLLIFPC